jgi:hypothetical protein
MKLCKDCKHCRELVAGTATWFCWHPELMHHSVDYVTGARRSIPTECYMARRIGECGEDAKLFELKNDAGGSGGGFVENGD